MRSKQKLGKFLLTAGLLTSLAILSGNCSARAQYLAADVDTKSKQTTSVRDKVSTGVSPASNDAAVIAGVSTAGTVRVNMLANIDAILNTGSNGVELVSIAWGLSLLLAALLKRKGMKQMAFACLPIALGLAVPGAINWLVSSARDANLFS